MGCFLGTVPQMTAGFLVAPDERAMQPLQQWNGPQSDRPFSEGALWTMGRLASGDGSWGLFGGDCANSADWEGPNVRAPGGGCASQKKIVGVSRDSTGNPLGSCIMKAIVTATDVLAGQVTSDSGGYFEVRTPYTGAHRLDAYKAGSPDVAGSSVNTIIPTD